MAGSIVYNPWQSVDRRAFHENAILLDCRCRTQGQLLRTSIIPSKHETSPDENMALPDVCSFLDDIALIAAGPGGKENVTAISMERDACSRITLRVAQNDGISPETTNDLESLLKHALTSPPSELSDCEPGNGPEYDKIFSIILSRCKVRLQKHAQRFIGELKNAHYSASTSYTIPRYKSMAGSSESRKDLAQLGPYNLTTHADYMKLNVYRFTRLRDLCQMLEKFQDLESLSTMRLLVQIAYEVRRSSSFRYFLSSNVGPTIKSRVRDKFANELIERLGKLSRFFRAGLTITAFARRLPEGADSILVRPVLTKKYAVTELRHRTVEDLRRRGGTKSFHYNDRFQMMLQRWDSYRLHAEMQLVIFHEENPATGFVTPYFGCDKLCCYLCYTFLVAHGCFKSSGSHQSLYSLWTLPVKMQFQSEERAENFTNAIRTIATDLERKVAQARRWSPSTSMFPMNNESFANLSRVSLLQHFIKPQEIIDTLEESRSMTGSHAMETILEGPSHSVQADSMLPEGQNLPRTDPSDPALDGLEGREIHTQDRSPTTAEANLRSQIHPTYGAEIEARRDHRHRKKRRRRRHLPRNAWTDNKTTALQQQYSITRPRHRRGQRHRRRRRTHARVRESFLYSLFRRFLDLFR